MIVRVNWAQPNSDGHSMYHVYEAAEYFVEWMDKRVGFGPSEEQKPITHARLMLDGDKHDIYLSNGDTAYIMNSEGKTVDIIRT